MGFRQIFYSWLSILLPHTHTPSNPTPSKLWLHKEKAQQEKFSNSNWGFSLYVILKLAFEKSIDSCSLELHCVCTLEMIINIRDFISERLHILMKTQHSTLLVLKWLSSPVPVFLGSIWFNVVMDLMAVLECHYTEMQVSETLCQETSESDYMHSFGISSKMSHKTWFGSKSELRTR